MQRQLFRRFFTILGNRIRSRNYCTKKEPSKSSESDNFSWTEFAVCFMVGTVVGATISRPRVIWKEQKN